MVLAKCIRNCWDSQATKQYLMGSMAELPEDHVFLTMKNPCFQIITADELNKSKEDLDSRFTQMAAVIAQLMKQVEDLQKGSTATKPDSLIPEEKRPVGRPPKTAG
jgi:hypothetical protein